MSIERGKLLMNEEFSSIFIGKLPWKLQLNHFFPSDTKLYTTERGKLVVYSGKNGLMRKRLV